MNPRCPTTTLNAAECKALRALVLTRGERAALVVIGLRSAETLYRATAELPVSLLTADVIRGRLDRI